MTKILGILLALVLVTVATAWNTESFLTPYNVKNLLNWIGLFGVISLGAAFVIIGGGIDLSIGSVVGLSACLLPWLLVKQGLSPWVGIPLVLAACAAIGLLHGVLITFVKLQPFVVTLCGLLCYRGLARWFTDDKEMGFGQGFTGLRDLVKSSVNLPIGGTVYYIPTTFLLMVALALAAAFLLNLTVAGRHLKAVGRNEQAARYSGVITPRVVIFSYVICSTAAGLGGMLFALDLNSVQPAGFGNFYELYAIAAAVIGGCSLRGGEGSVLGVVAGVAIIRLLFNSINLMGFPSQLEFAVIGLVILAGVLADTALLKLAAWNRRRQERLRAARDVHP